MDNSVPSLINSDTDCTEYPCNQCNWILISPRQLKKHQLQKHSSLINMNCQECSYVTTSMPSLSQHISLHAQEKARNIAILKNNNSKGLKVGKRSDCPSLPTGWYRQEFTRKTGVPVRGLETYVHYFSPNGFRVRSKRELINLLGDQIDLAMFDFKSGEFKMDPSLAIMVGGHTMSRGEAKRESTSQGAAVDGEMFKIDYETEESLLTNMESNSRTAFKSQAEEVDLKDDNRRIEINSSSRNAFKKKIEEVDLTMHIEDSKPELSIKKSGDGDFRLLSKNTVNNNITVSIVNEKITRPQKQFVSMHNESKQSEDFCQIVFCNINKQNIDKKAEDFNKNVDNNNIPKGIKESDTKYKEVEFNLSTCESAADEGNFVKSQEVTVDWDTVKSIIEKDGRKPYSINQEEILYESKVDVIEVAQCWGLNSEAETNNISYANEAEDKLKETSKSAQSESNIANNNNPKKGKKSSWVWNFMTPEYKQPDSPSPSSRALSKNTPGSKRATCNFCSKTIVYITTNTHLIKHVMMHFAKGKNSCWVWNYMTPENKEPDNAITLSTRNTPGSKRAICNICSKTIVYYCTSMSNLFMHVKRHLANISDP